MAAWLRELSGMSVAATNEAELQAQLKSGVVLCQAANRMGADIICGISQDDEMENIEKFVKFLQTAGVSRTSLFVATDLHANKNMEQVMIALNDLAEALYDYPGYSEGPTVGRPGRMKMLSLNLQDLESHVKPSVYFQVLAF